MVRVDVDVDGEVRGRFDVDGVDEDGVESVDGWKNEEMSEDV